MANAKLFINIIERQHPEHDEAVRYDVHVADPLEASSGEPGLLLADCYGTCAHDNPYERARGASEAKRRAEHYAETFRSKFKGFGAMPIQHDKGPWVPRRR